MEWVAIVTVAAMVQFIWFGLRVGQMRSKHGVRPPEMSGPPEFMRMFRVHYNTMEQLVLFFPALWMFAYFVDPRWAAALGLVFIVGRFLYCSGYIKDPKSRSTGFTIGFVVLAALMGGTLYGAVRALM